MAMDRKRYEELVRENNGSYKDFSQKVYMTRFGAHQNLDGVTGGMCRALAAAYIAKNRAKALANSVAAEDDFSTPDFTRDLMTENFFSALAIGRPSVVVKTINAWHPQVQQQHGQRFAALKEIHIASKSGDALLGTGPAARIEAEKLTVIQAVLMVSGGKMRFKDETPLSPGTVTTEQFPDREGYWIITAMGHAFAVCFRSGPKGKVFEPNFGQGVFPTYADCRAFLAQFTSEDEHYASKDVMLYVKEFSG